VTILVGMEQENIKSVLRRFLINGPARKWAHVLFKALISVELTGQRCLDIFQVPNKSLPSRQITAIIKTFNRPYELNQLVKSIRRVQPDLEVIIADDSGRPNHFPDITTLVLPFNSGVSIGRNAALDIVQTPFVLLLDDDFVFYCKTCLAEALRLMQQTPQIDIMGGKVINLPECQADNYRDAALFPTSNTPTLPKGSLLAGLPVYDKVANFFIARTDRLKLVRWDPELKLTEHADFFTRAKGILTTVYNDQFCILHAKNRFDRLEPERMQNLIDARLLLRQRYYGNSQ
jgi:glycosyltransferase involved in cell wall biosynthesis